MRRCDDILDAPLASGGGGQALEKGAKKKDAAFYEGQIKSAEFFRSKIYP